MACREEACGAANLSGFRFCQQCGVARKCTPVPTDQSALPDDEVIAARKSQVLAVFDEKSHERKKAKELDAFALFLASRPTVSLRKASVYDAMPADVVDFLVFRDLTGAGRTVVHEAHCFQRGSQGRCGCPVRMSQAAVHALASALRTRLTELGCGGEWSSQSATGNPANSAFVRKYLVAIKEEQGKAGCVAVTARQRALLPDKLRQLVSSMRSRIVLAYVPRSTEVLTLLQDIAWITVQFRSLSRGSELSDLRTDRMVVGPNDSCIAFQVTFSKVIRGGSAGEFGVPKVEGDESCPVRAMRAYICYSSQYFNWDWDEGSFPVFPFIGMRGSRLSAVTASAMHQRFRKHLKTAFASEDPDVEIEESLHGLRAGGALYKALQGESLEEIMLQGFWRSPSTALHYIGLLELLVGSEFALAVQQHGLVRQLPTDSRRVSTGGGLRPRLEIGQSATGCR